MKDTVTPQINSQSIAAQIYKLADQMFFTVIFSESVIVTGTPRLQINMDSQSQASLYANYISGSSSNQLVFSYQVSSGDSDSDGIALGSSIDLNMGTITDSAGNETDLNLQSVDLSGVLVDSETPLINSFVEPANATYGIGGKLLFQVNFSENVTVTGVPRFAIRIGTQTVYANYESGTGTTGLEFSYTIQAGEDDNDGIEILSSVVDLNGGSIKASDGDNAGLNFLSYRDPTPSVLVSTSSGITAPDQVQGVVTAPTTNNTTLSCSWSVPNNNGTEIINYSVQYREQGSSAWLNISPSPVNNQVNVSGLSSGVTYEFRVAANNGILGSYSNVSTAEIFDVSSLNPIAWLSATNVSGGGVEPSHGDKISSWADLTGVAGNATELDTSKQPTYETNIVNGLPAIRFNGEAQGLQGTFNRTNNGGLTIFVVGKMDSNNSRECFFEFFASPGTARGFFFNYGFNEANINFNLDDTSFNLWSAYDDGTKTDFYENNQTIYVDRNNWGTGKSTAFTGSGAYVLGDDQTGGDMFHGYIGEFLIFDKELSASETLALKTYLKNKWGTP